MVDNVLANASNVKCYAYDIIVHSASIEEIIKHLEKVMYLLRNHGLRVRLSKCFFVQPKVKLPGHVIDKHHVHTNGKRAQKITCAESPHDASELRSFFGLALYYRRFIKGFAKIANPMSEKTSEKVDLEWHDDMQAAFRRFEGCTHYSARPRVSRIW